MNEQSKELKKLYSEIVKGFTPVKYDGSIFYIKHFTIEEQGEVDYFYFEELERLKSRGIPSEAEMLEILDKKRIWTTKDEVELAQKQTMVEQLKKSRDQQFVPSQIEYYDKLVKDETAALIKKKSEKINLVGATRERFANNSLNSYFIMKSFFRNKEFTEPLFTDEDMENFEDEQVGEYNSLYNSSMKFYHNDSIKKIAVQSFFQNIYFLSENLYQFWGKPIKDLTIYQSELSSFARYFKGIIQNTNIEIPDEIRNDPDKLLSFAKMDDKMKEQMAKGKGHNVSFNANKEDLKKMGVKASNPYSVVARRLKRNLTKEEMLMIDRGEGNKIKP